MARTYTANQDTVAAQTDMEQSWLFTIVQNDSAQTTEYYSLKDYSYGGDSYDERVLDDGKFRGFKLRKGKSGYNIHAPDKIQFTLDNSDGALTASDYEGANVLIELVVQADSSLEEVMASAKYRVNAPPRDQYQTIVFDCIDFVSDKLSGVWPNTPLIKDLFPADDAPNPILDTMCVPVIVGDAYIPLRSVYVSADTDRYYVLGLADGETYEIEEIRSPRHQTLQSTWVSSAFESAGFTFTQATKASGGVNYRVFQPIISDSNNDGTADANGLWFQGDRFLDIPVLYRRDRTKFINGSETGTHDGSSDAAGLEDSGASWPVNGLVGAYVVNRTDNSYGRITANTATSVTATLAGGTDNDWDDGDAYTIGGPASIIRFVMTDSAEGMGFDTGDIDDTAFGAAELEFSTWSTNNNTGLVWNGGWYFQQNRKKVIADLLNMCHGYFETGEQIALRVLSKTNQVTLDKDDIEEDSFSWRPLQVKETDSAYVYMPKSGEPQDKLYPIQVPAKASYDNPSNASAHYHLIDDTEHAQNLRSLSLQRVILKDGIATFKMFPNHLKIMPDDVITVNDSEYGNFSMLVESIEIDLDMTMTVKAYTTYSALDDYSDMAFPEVTFSDHTGDTTAAYKFITAGPDGPPSSGDIPNVLPGRLRVGATGNFILLDPNDPIIKMDEGGVDRVLLGDVGSGVYGLQVNDENGDPVIKIVGTGGSAEHFFAQAITLGDGSNYSGSITLNHADGQGDTYVAGKDSAATFDFPNWEVDGGFILGVDDSESVDTTKFFVGDSGSNYLKYDGTEFVYHSGSSGALRILGGGDIFLEGDDAEGDKALVIFETDIQLGATVTTKALGLWDNAEGNDKYFVVGHEPTYVGSFTLERKPFMSVIVDTSYEFDVDVFHPNNGATSHAVLYLSTQSDDSQEYTQLGAYKGTDQASLIMRVYDTPQSQIYLTNVSGSDSTRLYINSNGSIEIDTANADPIIIFDTDGADRFALGVDDSDSYKFKINDGATLADNSLFEMDTTGSVTLWSDSAGQPAIRLHHTFNNAGNEPSIAFQKDRASPAAGEDLGAIYFQGDDSVGTNTTYVSMFAEASDPTNLQESGKYTIWVQANATNAELLTIDGDVSGQAEFRINQQGIDLDFIVEASGRTHAFWVEGNTGNIGINNDDPAWNLEVSSASPAIEVSSWSTSESHTAKIRLQKSGSSTINTLLETTDDEQIGSIWFLGVDSSSTAEECARIHVEQDGAATATAVPGRIMLMTADSSGNTTEALRIDSSQNVCIGGIDPAGISMGASDVVPRFQVHDTDEDAAIGVASWSSGTDPARLVLGRSDSGTIGTYSILADNANIGYIDFCPDDGVNLDHVAVRLIGEVDDGSPAAGDIGGQLTVQLHEGGGSLTTQFRIQADGSANFVGSLGVGNTYPDLLLTVGDRSSIADGRISNYEGTLDATTDYYHFYNSFVKTAGATDGNDDFHGFYNYAAHADGDATIGDIYGIINYAQLNSGTVADIFGIWSLAHATVSGTAVANVYGAWIQVDDDVGASGSVYGIYINEGDGVDYGIYHDGSGDNALNLSGGNLGIGVTAFGTNADLAIGIANGTAPTSSPANMVQLWAEDISASSELRVRDEAGNVTTLSPHNFSLFNPPHEMAWSYYSENDFGCINVDMFGAIRAVEELCGQQFIHMAGEFEQLETVTSLYERIEKLETELQELKSVA